MYLIDTDVVSELRKGPRADRGVRSFLEGIDKRGEHAYFSVVTLGEIRYGIEGVRARNDERQAERLEAWYRDDLVPLYDKVLPVDLDVALVWARLRARNPHHVLDKLIAATALIYDLTVVTRNERDFDGTGARVLNPFIG